MPDYVHLPSAPAGAEALRARDTSRPVLLVGFLDQGNLGLGYLAATLRRHGYEVLIFDVQADPAEVLAAAQARRPLLVGLSLIFQFWVDRFAALARRLRAGGVDCHFTMGGHFASLSWEETLALVPDLDSVVRFEGEYTLLELADRLGTGAGWRDVPGVAYRGPNGPALAPARALAADLDALPWPARDAPPETVLGHAALPLLASRGCARTCSFCSIHTFYRAAPGRVVRTRRPDEVVREMRALYEERGVTIFLFQDDDFPLFGPVWRRWAGEFVDALRRAGLAGRVAWKISCRADAVDAELFARLRDAGCYLVYMGLESGSEEGLRTLGKRMTVAQNVRAVETLKGLGVLFEYGFMMFDPSTTFESVRDNVAFLRAIVGDGSAGATFCRMLPYDGTPIKAQLAREGRLRGDVLNPDYDFLDPRVEAFYHELTRLVDVTGWTHGFEALSPQLNWAWHEVAVLERLFPPLAGLGGWRDALQAITRESNALLFEVVDGLRERYEDPAAARPTPWTPERMRAARGDFLARLHEGRDAFVARHQEAMYAALAAARAPLPPFAPAPPMPEPAAVGGALPVLGAPPVLGAAFV